MVTDTIIDHEIKQWGLEPIVKKHRLVPSLETWVSLKGNPLVKLEYTPYPNCGVKFYIEDSDVCVGMIQHVKTAERGFLRTSRWVKDTFGIKVLSSMPWEMDACSDITEFDNNVTRLIKEYRKKLVDASKFKLFKVELSDGGYDSYDSAVIACVDKATLEQLCSDQLLKYHWSDTHDIIFDQTFNIHSDQSVNSITEIGVYSGEMYRDTIARVICSSYNAG